MGRVVSDNNALPLTAMHISSSAKAAGGIPQGCDSESS